jgi:acetylornithine deacetylase/succinyl-diaminopimelate desuccinylase-like protein
LQVLLALLWTLPLLSAQAPAPRTGEAAFRELYRELIEINTTLSAGSCTAAAEAMGARLKAAGLPAGDIRILVPPDRPKDGNLIATLRGGDPQARPILLLAHLDVVEARREDWVRDPFKLVEEDGWFYARGASDDKAMAAVFTDSLIRFQTEGFRPRRDIKLALTCGEESPDTFNGVEWLIKNHPETLRAAFALNEGAGGELDDAGKPVTLQVQAGEKVYQDFTLETTNGGGHSSRPVKDNAIYHMAAGLSRISAWKFPIGLNPVTRAYFEAQTKLRPSSAADIRAVLKDPPDEAAAERLWVENASWNSMLRTTCVATMMSAGHAPNARPAHTLLRVSWTYSDYFRPIAVFAGTAAVPTYEYEGSVFDGGGPPRTPLNGAQVEILNGLPAGRTTLTGAMPEVFPGAVAIASPGHYAFFGIPEGTYRLRVSKSGYAAQEIETRQLTDVTLVPLVPQ